MVIARPPGKKTDYIHTVPPSLIRYVSSVCLWETRSELAVGVKHKRFWNLDCVIMTSPRALQLEQRALHAMHQSESLPAGWQLPRATFLSKTSYYATDQRNARGFAIFSYRAVSIRGLAPGSVFDYQQSSVLAESTAGCQSRLRQSILDSILSVLP